MTQARPEADERAALLQRIADLETRLQESEDTLGAIRRGEIDALVVAGPVQEHRIFTLESADRPYRVLIEQIQESAFTLSVDGSVLYCNRRLAVMLGIGPEQVIGRRLLPFILPEEQDSFSALLGEARQGPVRAEFTLCPHLGATRPAYLSLSPLVADDGAPLLCGVLTDLTDQKLHVRELADANHRLTEEIAERERVEDVLRQSQKMEAVGQLTGGIAHDFNNLLTGITGSLELLETRVAQGRLKDVARYVGAAQDAAKRAAALTHRLLAFSRRQTLDPKATDINDLVAGMLELVRRTVGPEIEVAVEPAPGLWITVADPSQLENALLNLCINARDAMPGGGALTIRSGNAEIEERQARLLELAPGDYLSLCVSDTGTGMTPDVVERAFDPFFTTKPIGTGTGLGLSMIYGFARQSGGQVVIESEVGRGTTVCLYLPRHHGSAAPADLPTTLTDAPRAAANETVLIVDDEPTIRMLIAEVLEDLGYTALEASDGAAGLRILANGTHIDLLVTDVGLPGGLNGRQLAEAALSSRPELKILFITGYAESAALNEGHLRPNMRILTKPFAMETLASRLRDLI